MSRNKERRPNFTQWANLALYCRGLCHMAPLAARSGHWSVSLDRASFACCPVGVSTAYPISACDQMVTGLGQSLMVLVACHSIGGCTPPLYALSL